MGQFEAGFFYPSYRKRKNVTRNAKIFQHGAVWGASLKRNDLKVPKYYNCGSRLGQILHTCLRLNCSSLK